MGLRDWYARARKKVVGRAPTTNILPEIEREREMRKAVSAAYSGKSTKRARKSGLVGGLGNVGNRGYNILGELGQMGANFSGSNVSTGGMLDFGVKPRKSRRRR
jgi:PPE-repeat protein